MQSQLKTDIESIQHAVVNESWKYTSEDYYRMFEALKKKYGLTDELPQRSDILPENSGHASVAV